MSIFSKAYNDIKAFKKVIAVLLIVCVFVGIASGLFYQQVQSTIKKESDHYLSELSSRTADNIQRIVNDNFAILNTLKSVIENNDIKHFDIIHLFLEKQITLWEFTDILLIDAAGLAYDLEGNKVIITGDSFLRTLSVEERSISPTQIINNEEKTIFTVPLNNIVLDGREIIAISTMYNPEQFDAILSMDSFDKQAYSCIVDQTGNVVIRSASKQSREFGYNIFQTLLDTSDSGQEGVDTLKKNIKANSEGQLEFDFSDTSEYLVHTPIGISDWHLFTFVPTTVVNANSNLLLQSTAALIFAIFSVFLIFLIFIIYTFMRNKRRLEQIAYVDTLTKGHTAQYFYSLVKEKLATNQDIQHAIIFTNIQRFKVLNDQFGRESCDKILVSIHKGIQSKLYPGEYVGHYAADNFVILIEYKDDVDLQKRLMEWKLAGQEFGSQVMDSLPIFTVEHGIYIIEDNNIGIEDMIDRTKLALRNGYMAHKEDDHTCYAYYNEDVRHQLIREKHLEDMMENALLNNEFKMFLQPKYSTGTKKIGGAEALVRWQSHSDGMIFPNDFIPLFEKNGFIVKLDLWMFDQACKLLQAWKNEGKELLAISVNCSRAHLKNQNFLEAYIDIFSNYDFPARYLELEFTENMVLDETQRFSKVIDEVHAIGFECSMDDFGSGYSSLNVLQDIRVDTLKLDGVFFKKDLADEARTKAIVRCVLDMAKSLEMATVAEGIEEWGQVDVLEDLGCNYIQGYVYAKPMPIEEFEALAFSKSST